MFADMLRTALAQAGMTQAELARRIGAATITVSRYVRGMRIPGRPRRRLIAQVLGVPEDFFEKNLEKA